MIDSNISATVTIGRRSSERTYIRTLWGWLRDEIKVGNRARSHNRRSVKLKSQPPVISSAECAGKKAKLSNVKRKLKDCSKRPAACATYEMTQRRAQRNAAQKWNEIRRDWQTGCLCNRASIVNYVCRWGCDCSRLVSGTSERKVERSKSFRSLYTWADRSRQETPNPTKGSTHFSSLCLDMNAARKDGIIQRVYC